MITGTKFKVGDFALVFLRRDYSCVEIIGIIEETTRTKDTITYVVKHKEGGAEEMLDSHYVFSKTEIKCMTQRIIMPFCWKMYFLNYFYVLFKFEIILLCIILRC